MKALWITLLFSVTAAFTSDVSNCVWSPNHEYCLSYLNSDAVHILVRGRENETVFPKEELYAHLRDYQAKPSQVSVIEFADVCNVTFNTTLLHHYSLSSLTSMVFDEKCKNFSEKHNFCLEIPKTFGQNITINNIKRCKSQEVEEVHDENQEFITIELQEDEHQEDLVRMLNSSLFRTMNLYEVTEHTNRVLTKKMSELERNLQECQVSRNDSIDMMLYTRRKLGKCMDTRLREKRLKMEKVKELVETIYDGILDILHLT